RGGSRACEAGGQGASPRLPPPGGGRLRADPTGDLRPPSRDLRNPSGYLLMGGRQVLDVRSSFRQGARSKRTKMSREAGFASESRNSANGGRSRSKSARHLSQSRPQEQDPAHDLPRERGEAARRGHLVR